MPIYEKTGGVAPVYDTVVCGGGPSGWIAAISAAREGEKVALIERFGFFGGAATANFVVPISGFYKNGRRVIGGIAWEFIEKLLEEKAALIELPKGHISVNTEYYKLIAQRMVLASGVHVYCNSYLSGAICEDGTIQAVTVCNKGGTQTIYGRCFIDATGDGDLCKLANAPVIVHDVMQPLSLCFTLSGVDITTPLLKDCIHQKGINGAPSCNGVIRAYLDTLYAKGEAPMFGGPWFNTMVNGDDIAVNITRSVASVLDNDAYSTAEFQMREDMFKLVELLKQGFAEFRSCAISASANNAGVREGRHLVGIHTLTGDELQSPEMIPDPIALAAHPIDIHKTDGSGQILKQTKEAGRIPYRAMVTHEVRNLIAAGRIISADSEAFASIRVQGTCMATGEAAGVAAALCSVQNCAAHEVRYDELRDILLSRGAVL